MISNLSLTEKELHQLWILETLNNNIKISDQVNNIIPRLQQLQLYHFVTTLLVLRENWSYWCGVEKDFLQPKRIKARKVI